MFSSALILRYQQYWFIYTVDCAGVELLDLFLGNCSCILDVFQISTILSDVSEFRKYCFLYFWIFCNKPETGSIDSGNVNSIDNLKENSILGQFFLREKNGHGFFHPQVEILSYQGIFPSGWISYSAFFYLHNVSWSSQIHFMSFQRYNVDALLVLF